MSYPPYAGRRPDTSAAAIVALVLGIVGGLATPAFGLFTVIPAAAAIVGAVALRRIHTHRQRGRTLALWGFWLGAAFFLLDFALLMIAAIATHLGL
ncbi:DUF4190 domain-containing protein [Nocardiopsis suaedae]|uniref:DUF4190 domain-containing protein n=1 Tax=Nocardiopsis suaedae TaxID=3018444 RepID=A0ABT4TNK2_9ACTN|nr:DUF4190 domain-containing protein [Nocardiopsis suaedae]MDA2805692.1 DUF4190 domain-containing protein [Nocardiopsis suaedae]